MKQGHYSDTQKLDPHNDLQYPWTLKFRKAHIIDVCIMMYYKYPITN